MKNEQLCNLYFVSVPTGTVLLKRFLNLLKSFKQNCTLTVDGYEALPTNTLKLSNKKQK